jgi:hypothetical protein
MFPKAINFGFGRSLRCGYGCDVLPLLRRPAFESVGASKQLFALLVLCHTADLVHAQRDITRGRRSVLPASTVMG